MVAESTLTILTLNVWGLFMVSQKRSERIKAISTALSKGSFDIVCLQEVWVAADFEKIKEETKPVLPYSHFFHSGVTGSGLCIFSRWPMEDIIFHQWPVNGYIHKIYHGDWFGGKGIGLCHIVANGVHINLYTTHLHAQYDLNDDEYLAHRVVQAFDTAQFIRLTSEGAHLSVLAGDLNTQPGDLCHRLIQYTAQLTDSYEAHGPDEVNGTNECSRNSFADSKKVAANPKGDRIDHILYRSGLNSQVEVVSYSMPLESRVPNCDYSYSDHEAISATFKVTVNPLEVSHPSCYIEDKGELRGALVASISVCDEALAELARTKVLYYAITVTLLVAMLSVPFITNLPTVYTKSYQMCIVFVSGVMFFTFLMATLWNRMEHHGVLGGQLRMRVVLDRLMSSDASATEQNGDAISAMKDFETRHRGSVTLLD